MSIDASRLARSIGALTLDLERGLAVALQELTNMLQALFGVATAGLMLVDERGDLHWATAADQQGQVLEAWQERLAQGPCARAFAEGKPVAMRDVTQEPEWAEIAGVYLAEGIRAALSVPVELGGSPIGTLDLYDRRPRDWTHAEVSALEACAGILAVLLGAAAQAHLQGQLAAQLQHALDHRVLIEQAKGVLMEREGIDTREAFERLRAMARSSRRKTADVAREILGQGQAPRPGKGAQGGGTPPARRPRLN